MATTETTTKKPTARRVTKKVKVPAQATEEPVEKKPVQAAKKTTVVKPKQLDPNMYVTVRNGYPGLLIYKSSKTGEKFLFQGFGDEHEIELQELKKAKNDQKAFFINNWFLIDDPEVIEYLGVKQYYKDAFSYDEFEALTTMTADEVREKMRNISKGQRVAVARYARRLITEGRIDSLKVIAALEEGLGVQLTDK